MWPDPIPATIANEAKSAPTPQPMRRRRYFKTSPALTRPLSNTNVVPTGGPITTSWCGCGAWCAHIHQRVRNQCQRRALTSPSRSSRSSRLNVKTLVAFQIDPDGYAINEAIVLNEKTAEDGLARLHEVGPVARENAYRAWQRERCHDDLFDEQGRQGFRSWGSPSLPRPHHDCAGRGHFRELLRREKIETPAGEIPWPKPEQMGKSTNSLWSCLCQKVRVGTSDLCGAYASLSRPNSGRGTTS